MKLYVVGGGGCLIRNFADYDASQVIINDDNLKRFIQEDVKSLTNELAETEALLQKLEDSKRSQMYAIWDIEQIKEKLLSFGKYAEEAAPDILITLI